MPFVFSRGEIESAISRLGELANLEGTHVELLIVGGAAMVLAFGARESTKDVDFAPLGNTDLQVVRRLARQVAQEKGWNDDWLNDAAKGFLHGVSFGDTVFESSGIRVYSPSTAQLLAMKLTAWRDDVDIADAELLLGRAGASTIEETWSQIAEFVPPGYELKASYALEDLWNQSGNAAPSTGDGSGPG